MFSFSTTVSSSGRVSFPGRTASPAASLAAVPGVEARHG